MNRCENYILIFSLFLSLAGFGQTSIVPETLTIEDGLSQGFVAAILQDQEGFLWFGSKNGLNRYDGKQFEIYTHNPDNPYSISNDWVTNILEKDDFLIIGTRSPFLNLFNKRTKQFYRIPLNVDGIKTFSETGEMYMDNAGQLWVEALIPNQVLRINFPDRFWEDLSKDATRLNEIKIDLALNGRFYTTNAVSTDFIVVSETLKTAIQLLNIHTLDKEDVDTKSVLNKFPFFKMISPNLAVCNTTFKNTFSFNICRQINGVWEVIPSNYIIWNSIHYDKTSNLIWLQNYENHHILAFDLEKLYTLKKIEENQADFVVNDSRVHVLQFYADRSGILWIGTGGLGIRKLSPRKLAIENYLPGVSMPPTNLISIYEGELIYPNDQIISSSGKHSNPDVINRLIEQKLPFEVSWLNNEPDNQWLAVAISTSDNFDFDLVLYHYKNDLLHKKMKIPLTIKGVQSDMSLLQAQNQKLYLSIDHYFISYDPKTGVPKTYLIPLLDKKASTIFFMAQTANDNFWIGTDLGLIRVQAQADGFKFNWIDGLRNDICASVLTDPENPNILWIGTKGGGLHRLDTEIMEFSYLDTRNGLPNDVIYGILHDEEGNLWLSSNKGIISYNPETGKIRNFTAADGMQSDEFNTFAFGKSPEGNMMFGGINGLSVFDPNDLKDNPNLPVVRLTGLAINNEQISVLDSSSVLNESIAYTKELSLSYSENSITLQFAALEFTTPSKNIFSYYLEGAEEAWAHNTTDNRATYLNLAPGQYQFKIKAANGDLVWGEKVSTLNITIRPPWYRSTLAYLVYFMLGGLGIWLFIYFQRKRLELRHSIELEQKEAARLKELDQAKSKLYTNITHEFRTPLTVISGLAEQMEVQSLEKDKLLIKRNSDQLDLFGHVNQPFRVN